ncbi:hypothetical protein F5Y16DRAFT_71183 [Xylariaceae sp. FL0255]|nr:hypothetical protein F5Y16DRAFT_71183 [Xylariaceae sp. FL0255]
MARHWYRLCAFVFLVLCLQDAIASPQRVVLRDGTTSTAPPLPKISSSTQETSTAPTTSTPTPTPTDATTSTTAVVKSSSVAPSATSGNDSSNTTSLLSPTSTVEPGQLPLTPKLTPAWGVAGALLLITGPIYAVVGIQHALIHTFISSAFLASLGITVLIIYVMNPPISNAIQGAYLVAAVVSGLIIGGGVTVFREITEGFGCLLGGFCFAMWLLCLKAGGLVTTTGGKVGLIAAFAVGLYAFYFSKYTRPYTLLGSMAFAGATATVIGIDCFSKAGLKEFWVYIWALNGKLFPYGVTTYPVTRGIQVELAVTVVFTVVGVISQSKLWKMIAERRGRNARAQAEARQMRDEEEARIGRLLEAQVGRERVRWENVYRDEPRRDSVAESGESEGFENEKIFRSSRTVIKPLPSEEEMIEMAELPSPNPSSSSHPSKEHLRPAAANQEQDKITAANKVRDVSPSAPNASEMIFEKDEKVWLVGTDGEARPISTMSARNSKRVSQRAVPGIALASQSPRMTDQQDNRLSFVDKGDLPNRNVKRSSIRSTANRLSASSGKIMRDMSEKSKQMTRDFESPLQSPKFIESTEELVSEPQRRASDAQSVAATLDGLSLYGQDLDEYHGEETESNAGRDIAAHQSIMGVQSKSPKYGLYLEVRPYSLTETVGTDILDGLALNRSPSSISKRSSTNQDGDKSDIFNGNSNRTDTALSESSRPPKSATHSATSANAPLTKERLPSALSRAALSYRTNEWAKHLSSADTLPVEQLQLNETSEAQNRKEEPETAAPVKIDALQQTAEGVVLVATISRSPSAISNISRTDSPDRLFSRVPSVTSPPKTQIPSALAILTGTDPGSDSQTSPVKTVQPSHSLRNKGRRVSDVQIQPIIEENADSNGITVLPAPSPTSEGTQPLSRTPIPGIVSKTGPQTSVGKRDMLMRNKSNSQLYTTPIQEHPQTLPPRPLNQTPTPYYTPSPTNSSPYNNILDADDLPLSQRKQLMRQNSMLSVYSNAGARPQPRQRSSTQSLGLAARYSSVPNLNTGMTTADTIHPLSTFDSHQPQRGSAVASQADRNARLSNFRQSVAADLRHLTSNLLGGNVNSNVNLTGSGNPYAERAIDQQRYAMLSQKDQEATRREALRWEKERNDRVIEEMMRNGPLVDAHRDAMRRMQGSVKH